MLSILIPTYNYNAFPLAQELEKQVLALNIPFELICLDDGSSSPLNKENHKINALTNCKFIEEKTNLGTLACRKSLATQAKYSWLLFLDADVMPKKDNFLDEYLKTVSQNPDVTFGGIAYVDSNKESSKTLRWTYGINREQKSIEERNKRPYASFISGCFLIKKSLILDITENMLLKGYGLDILFSYQLKNSDAKILHINNPVIHLGLDSNEAYLKKSKRAVDILFYLSKNNLIPANYTSLLSHYNTLKKFGLKSLFGKFIAIFNKPIEANLTGPKPNLFLFDLYRLGYLCNLKN